MEQWRKKQAKGDVIIVRYADDAVLGFQHRDEAERFLAELKERLAKFGLELHPEKTRLIEFGRYAAERREKRGEGKPETFNFSGFTHICGTSHKTGFFRVKRKTMGQKAGSEAERYQGEAADATARGHRGYSEVAQGGGEGVFPIPCNTGQRGTDEGVPP